MAGGRGSTWPAILTVSILVSHATRDGIAELENTDCVTKGRLRGGRGEWVWCNAA